MTVLTYKTKGGKDWIPRYVVSINQEDCIGCGRCFKACGRDVLMLITPDEDDEDADDDAKSYMSIANVENCIGCEACSRVCPKKCFTHKEVSL